MSDIGEKLAKFLMSDTSTPDPGASKQGVAKSIASGGSVETPRPATVKDLTHEDIVDRPTWDIPSSFNLSDEYYNWFRARLPFTPEAEWNKDLVRGDRSTNVSGRAPRETERLSRLADRLNNRLYLGPADIGHRTFTMGTDPIKFSQLYQLPKIETEETRQMERMRQYETADRTRDIQRQNDYKDMDRLWAQMHMIETMRREGRMSDAQADAQKAPLLEEIRRMQVQWDTTNTKHMQSWLATINQMKIPLWKANQIMAMSGKDPIFAQILAGVFGAPGAPDMMQMLQNTALLPIYQDPNLSSTDKILRTAQYKWDLGVQMAHTALGVGADELRALVNAYNQGGQTVQGMFNVLTNGAQ